MNTPNSSGILTAILPCNDLDASERFYNQLMVGGSPVGCHPCIYLPGGLYALRS